jgi:phenolic acid decarboxylase
MKTIIPILILFVLLNIAMPASQANAQSTFANAQSAAQASTQPQSQSTTRSTSQSTRQSTAQSTAQAPTHIYIDVHELGAGKVTAADVARAHTKDLAVEKKYGVHFINYWVDEDKGKVYCLSTAPDSLAIRNTHAEAHGLLPAMTYEVTDGQVAKLTRSTTFFLDVHELGAGKVTAAAVAQAHTKDLAVEKKYGVNFINYWVDEKQGVVLCLSQAPDSLSVINTHKEAHGLIPAYIMRVEPGGTAAR